MGGSAGRVDWSLAILSAILARPSSSGAIGAIGAAGLRAVLMSTSWRHRGRMKCWPTRVVCGPGIKRRAATKDFDISPTRHRHFMICGEPPNVAGRSKETFRPTVRHPKQGWAFIENVRRLGLEGSRGTIGDCYDTAPMESCWGDADRAAQPSTPDNLPRAVQRHVGVHRVLLQPRPTSPFSRTPDPDRVRGSTLKEPRSHSHTTRSTPWGHPHVVGLPGFEPGTS